MSEEMLPVVSSNTSKLNSEKLDRILAMLEGFGQAPGLLSKVEMHDKILFGEQGKDGLISKVNTLWRIHVWLSCSVSAIIGYFVREIIKH